MRLRRPGITDLEWLVSVMDTSGNVTLTAYETESDATAHARSIELPGSAYVSRIAWHGEQTVASWKARK